ncbi:MAG: transcription antitermination factor NusB [Patescibacteria group bacterium]
MANRRLSRSIVLQTLFEWDASGYNISSAELKKRLDANALEFGGTKGDEGFMKDLMNTVVAKRIELDAVIEKAAPEWPIDKIAQIDRNILRIGLSELLFADRAQVPSKVAINEAIELGKSFGSDTSGKFINGVLGAVYIEMGEPGKNDGPKRPKKPSRDKMPREELVGAVTYARDSGNVYLSLVHDIFGHWTLSKGKLQSGETHEDGLRRKVKEEMGLDVIAIQDELGENEYIANDPAVDGGKKIRHATYFLAEVPFNDLILKKEGGLDDAQWFPLAAAGDLNFYDDILPVVTRAINILVQKRG